MKPSPAATLCKLAAVGAFFYASYGLANHIAAERADVPEIVFGWESAVPFWPWTIVPYWSLNLLYALAFFLCADVRAQNRYIAQLLAAQVLAVSCFLLFPLQFSWPKPPVEGWFGSLFASLAAFDKPYNQAPSLHIMLTLIVGRFYWYRLPRPGRPLWAAWMLLIALSVLTTWQHHFIDIPTGLLAGALVLWALPWRGNEAAPSPLRLRLHKMAAEKRLFWTGFYLVLAGVAAACAGMGGAWLWLLWPAVSCLMVAAAYAGLGAGVFQKQENGRHSLAAALLLLPYTAGAYLNLRFWLAGQKRHAAVTERLHIGSIAAAGRFQAALDVCAELPVCRTIAHYRSLPLTDMLPPAPQQLAEAADSVQQLLDRSGGAPVLACCALGYGRSAAVVLTWLMRHGGHDDFDRALATLRRARPQVRIPPETREAVLAALKTDPR